MNLVHNVRRLHALPMGVMGKAICAASAPRLGCILVYVVETLAFLPVLWRSRCSSGVPCFENSSAFTVSARMVVVGGLRAETAEKGGHIRTRGCLHVSGALSDL